MVLSSQALYEELPFDGSNITSKAWLLSRVVVVRSGGVFADDQIFVLPCSENIVVSPKKARNQSRQIFQKMFSNLLFGKVREI